MGVRTAISFGIAIVLITGVATWLTSASLVGPPVPSYLQAAPDAAATAEASHAVGSAPSSESCDIVRSRTSLDLPNPYQRCVSASGVVYSIQWTSSAENGLIFAPNAVTPSAPDTCIRHLGGAWWAYMSEGNQGEERVCANSFTFQGGP